MNNNYRRSLKITFVFSDMTYYVVEEMLAKFSSRGVLPRCLKISPFQEVVLPVSMMNPDGSTKNCHYGFKVSDLVEELYLAKLVETVAAFYDVQLFETIIVNDGELLPTSYNQKHQILKSKFFTNMQELTAIEYQMWKEYNDYINVVERADSDWESVERISKLDCNFNAFALITNHIIPDKLPANLYPFVFSLN